MTAVGGVHPGSLRSTSTWAEADRMTRQTGGARGKAGPSKAGDRRPEKSARAPAGDLPGPKAPADMAAKSGGRRPLDRGGCGR